VSKPSRFARSLALLAGAAIGAAPALAQEPKQDGKPAATHGKPAREAARPARAGKPKDMRARPAQPVGPYNRYNPKNKDT
jgi:hypothetical protein